MKVFRDNPRAEIPNFATSGSACFDIKACMDLNSKVRLYNSINKETESVVKIILGKPAITIHPMFRALVPTGLIFDIPKGHVLKLYPRSGLALKSGLVLGNGTGIIDSDYVDPTFVILHNVSDAIAIVSDGDRVAQGMLEKVLSYTIEETDTAPKQKTERNGGFGSTGV